ncbi:hypothetical protein C7M84_000182 [Penaeus vannamei]|uniref:Uncharacterized protein n=1 Tax=Penaeus vannamei TaxID=6689 RepID=A0A423TX92_PENVA|nr:hypothetical protein C7M84_000182 [Penaeus vannamei]
MSRAALARAVSRQRPREGEVHIHPALDWAKGRQAPPPGQMMTSLAPGSADGAATLVQNRPNLVKTLRKRHLRCNYTCKYFEFVILDRCAAARGLCPSARQGRRRLLSLGEVGTGEGRGSTAAGRKMSTVPNSLTFDLSPIHSFPLLDISPIPPLSLQSPTPYLYPITPSFTSPPPTFPKVHRPQLDLSPIPPSPHFPQTFHRRISPLSVVLYLFILFLFPNCFCFRVKLHLPQPPYLFPFFYSSPLFYYSISSLSSLLLLSPHLLSSSLLSPLFPLHRLPHPMALSSLQPPSSKPKTLHLYFPLSSFFLRPFLTDEIFPSLSISTLPSSSFPLFSALFPLTPLSLPPPLPSPPQRLFPFLSLPLPSLFQRLISPTPPPSFPLPPSSNALFPPVLHSPSPLQRLISPTLTPLSPSPTPYFSPLLPPSFPLPPLLNAVFLPPPHPSPLPSSTPYFPPLPPPSLSPLQRLISLTPSPLPLPFSSLSSPPFNALLSPHPSFLPLLSPLNALYPLTPPPSPLPLLTPYSPHSLLPSPLFNALFPSTPSTPPSLPLLPLSHHPLPFLHDPFLRT